MATIEARTIGGTCWLKAEDVTAALRIRADEIEAMAVGLGETLEVGSEPHIKAVAYHSVAIELRERADWVDVAVIEHLTDHPGDSDLS